MTKSSSSNCPVRLKEYYERVVRFDLMERFRYGNLMEVPKLIKIVLNMGVGEAVHDSKKVLLAAADLALIAGQRPVLTRARRAVSDFKVRENMSLGAKVTLRRDRMYEFLDRLVNIALPRVRDFRGLNPKGFDGGGNYSMGLKEQIVFPEIDYDRVTHVLGMDVTICTSSSNNEEALMLLRSFNLPFC